MSVAEQAARAALAQRQVQRLVARAHAGEILEQDALLAVLREAEAAGVLREAVRAVQKALEGAR